MTQEEAFINAFDEYADVLFRHAYFRVSDREKAKDIVSDTFTRTWDYLVKGNVVQEFKPFLYRTINRLIIDEYRKKRVDSLDALLDESDVPEGVFPELTVGSREEVEFSIDASRVTELVAEMPIAYREVVLMRYIDGFMPSEIAGILDDSVNSVSVRIHRGIQWLANHIDKKWQVKNDK